MKGLVLRNATTIPVVSKSMVVDIPPQILPVVHTSRRVGMEANSMEVDKPPPNRPVIHPSRKVPNDLSVLLRPLWFQALWFDMVT